MNKKIAIVNTSSPFNTPDARESLDLALIFGAYEQQVSVIFIGNGVYQLLAQQSPEAIQTKDFLATMKAFELYDIEQLIVCKDSLEQAGLAPQQISLDVQFLDKRQIAVLLETFDHVVTM